MKTKWRILFVTMICAQLIVACQPIKDLVEEKPVQTARQFIQALNSNNPSRALDFVCESMIMPSLPKNVLKKIEFSEISNDDLIAEVQVWGEIRLEYQDVGALKKNMDFTLILYKRGNDWCVNRESLVTIVEALADISY